MPLVLAKSHDSAVGVLYDDGIQQDQLLLLSLFGHQ
jgi:hypothetical protein